ncbi:Prevent host death protein, Phd antitoxin [Candidatus Burkholderia brachyanthoides]|nr:Prevent host death protein, Phd antitoxin [Candidatus Burkholderia brachyanthoides]
MIRDLGVQNGRFSLEVWRPDEAERERASRPDRAEAMKQTHSNTATAAYEKWFREQVQESLDDPRPNLQHAQVQKEMADKKAALRKRIEAGGA